MLKWIFIVVIALAVPACSVDQLRDELVKTRVAIENVETTDPAVNDTLTGMSETLTGVEKVVTQLETAEGTADIVSEIARMAVMLLLGGTGTGAVLSRKIAILNRDIGTEKIASFNAGTERVAAGAVVPKPES